MKDIRDIKLKYGIPPTKEQHQILGRAESIKVDASRNTEKKLNIIKIISIILDVLMEEIEDHKKIYSVYKKILGRIKDEI